MLEVGISSSHSLTVFANALSLPNPQTTLGGSFSTVSSSNLPSVLCIGDDKFGSSTPVIIIMI